MKRTQEDTSVRRISQGKFQGINALANTQGIIVAAAMDQRSSLQRAFARIKGSVATDDEIREFKHLVTEEITGYASAILLDPQYSLEALESRAPHTGVLLSYEISGYDPTLPGRLPALLPQWSVRRLIAAQANAIKVLLYYDPDDREEFNIRKHALVERVGAECHAHDIPFFLEVLTYSDSIGPENSLVFARAKPSKVKKAMIEFSRPHYEVDMLKVEVPINIRYVDGSMSNTGPSAYSREDARCLFAEIASVARVPFIYLSAGVSIEIFLDTLRLAAEVETPFSGVLCGRAVWQDGIPIYLQQGAQALRQWLRTQGVHNMQALDQVLAKVARPWWDFYGGRQSIEVF